MTAPHDGRCWHPERHQIYDPDTTETVEGDVVRWTLTTDHLFPTHHTHEGGVPARHRRQEEPAARQYELPPTPGERLPLWSVTALVEVRAATRDDAIEIAMISFVGNSPFLPEVEEPLLLSDPHGYLDAREDCPARTTDRDHTGARP